MGELKQANTKPNTYGKQKKFEYSSITAQQEINICSFSFRNANSNKMMRTHKSFGQGASDYL